MYLYSCISKKIRKKIKYIVLIMYRWLVKLFAKKLLEILPFVWLTQNFVHVYPIKKFYFKVMESYINIVL